MSDPTPLPLVPLPNAPTEPLITVGVVTSFAALVLGIVSAIWLPLDDALKAKIMGGVAIAAPMIVAFIGRLKVFSPATVRAMVINRR